MQFVTSRSFGPPSRCYFFFFRRRTRAMHRAWPDFLLTGAYTCARAYRTTVDFGLAEYYTQAKRRQSPSVTMTGHWFVMRSSWNSVLRFEIWLGVYMMEIQVLAAGYYCFVDFPGGLWVCFLYERRGWILARVVLVIGCKCFERALMVSL